MPVRENGLFVPRFSSPQHESLYELARAHYVHLRSGDATAPRWWLLTCKGQCERATADALRCQGQNYFIALEPHRVRSGGMWHDSQRALFPGYLFFFGRGQDFGDAFSMWGSRQRLGLRLTYVKDQVQLVQELITLDDLLERASMMGQSLLADRLHVGEEVNVIAGPYLGARGIVETAPLPRALGGACVTRLWVNLTTLGRAVSVELDLDAVERSATHTDDARTQARARTSATIAGRA